MEFACLSQYVLTIRSWQYFKTAMGWQRDPQYDQEHCSSFDYLEDLNGRKFHDAHVVQGACCNERPKTILEIGTSHGRTTKYMSLNAPEATIYTVNLPPEGEPCAGKHITHLPAEHEIGRLYREAGCSNVRQILANTADWTPDFGPIDVAFIDGCHDADFVYNDTLRILPVCRPGSVIIWHDFNPDLAHVFGWIGEVCHGIDRLLADRVIRGRILHLQDSWCGLYRVP